MTTTQLDLKTAFLMSLFMFAVSLVFLFLLQLSQFCCLSAELFWKSLFVLLTSMQFLQLIHFWLKWREQSG